MRHFQPAEVCIEVTDRCVLNCVHCSSFEKEGNNVYSKRALPLAQLESTLDDIASLGGSIVELSGGEPLLYPSLFEVIEATRSRGLEARLYTSGITLGKDGELVGINVHLAKALVDAGLDRIIFNLQGTEETHERITRTRGIYPQVIQGMVNVKTVGLWVGAHFVPMRWNWREIEDVLGLCDHLGIDELAILRFFPQGRGKLHRSELELRIDEFEKLLKRIVRLKGRADPKADIRTGCPLNFCRLFDDSLPTSECRAAQMTCTITPQGDVVPCPAFKQNGAYSAGNIFEMPFRDIWEQGVHWEAFRAFDATKLIGPCRSCQHVDWCKGRCAAQRIDAHGSFETGPDPHCPLVYQRQNKTRRNVGAVPHADEATRLPAAYP